MAIVGASTLATTANGTSLTFSLAASVGDLLVAVIACDAPRNVIVPSYYTAGTAASWVPLTRGTAQDADFLSLAVYYKTVTALDVALGSSYTFNTTYADDPSGQGQNFSTMNMAGVLLKMLPTAGGNAGLDVIAPQQYLRGTTKAFQLPLLTGTRPDRFMTAAAVIGPVNPTWSHDDAGASSVRNPTVPSGVNQMLSLNVFFSNTTGTTYPYQLTTATNLGPSPSISTVVAGFSDASTAWLYTAPFVREGIPSPTNRRLMENYSYHEGYTVINQGGTFQATRFYTQDQLAAATQTFTGTQQVTATDRTNILNDGIGGDFRPLA